LKGRNCVSRCTPPLPLLPALFNCPHFSGVTPGQWHIQYIHKGAMESEDLGDGSPPVGSRGKAPVEGLGQKHTYPHNFFM